MPSLSLMSSMRWFIRSASIVKNQKKMPEQLMIQSVNTDGNKIWWAKLSMGIPRKIASKIIHFSLYVHYSMCQLSTISECCLKAWEGFMIQNETNCLLFSLFSSFFKEQMTINRLEYTLFFPKHYWIILLPKLLILIMAVFNMSSKWQHNINNVGLYTHGPNKLHVLCAITCLKL